MIQIDSVEKSYGKRKALSSYSAQIGKGSIFALLGPNGSGKTTLIRLLLGLSIPDAGNITIHGLSLDAFKKQSYIGYMPQSPLFPENLRVKEIISYLEELSHAESVFQKKLIDDLKMEPFWNERFGNLSLGMKQKVNILQCFMADLDLYVIDEPTASLDPGISYYLKQLFLEKKKANKTLLFTSHIMSEVEDIASEMSVLIEGRVVASGSPAQFIQSMKSKNLEEGMIHFWKENK